MQIQDPIVSEIAERVYAINEYGYDNIYVIVGIERALVINTGVGCINLRAAVRRLTFLPYDVVLTDGHIAHAGGIGQFGEIYAYPGEYEQAMSASFANSLEFCESVESNKQQKLWRKARPDQKNWNSIPSFNELYEGKVFDLGDRQVKVLRTSGHTLGGCSFIDDKSRIAFVGDACVKNLDITECYVSSALRGLLNLRRHESEYDRIFASDTGNASVTSVVSLSKKTLYSCIAACRMILNDECKFSVIPDIRERSVRRMILGDISLDFCSDRIYEKEEEPEKEVDNYELRKNGRWQF